MKSLSRRHLLQSLGISAAAARFLPAHIAQAADAAPPKRLIIYWTPNGLLHGEFRPDGGETDFRLRRVLQPLERFRNKMLVLDNVDWQCFFKHPIVNSHAPACMSLTGVAAKQFSGPHDATGPSVDQFIAQKLNRPGSFDGLVTGMNTFWPNSRVFYRASGQYVTGSNSATDVFKRLFGSTPTSPEAQRLRDNKLSVLDRVREELKAVQGRVSSEDRSRLAAHLDHVRTLEEQLKFTPSVACAAGTGPVKDATTPPASGAAMLEVLTLALKCDLTRVASLCWTGPGGAGNMVYDWLGAEGRHHDLSHSGRPSSGQPRYESLVKIGRFHAEQLATFLDGLDAVRESNGRTMLDNSVVLWTSEHAGNKVGAEDHERRDVPFVLFGSGQGYFRTGRFVDCKGRPHNEVLLSLIHAMGLTQEKTFGDPELCAGPMPGLA